MKLLFILSFITVYAFFGIELGYAASSPWHTHITYMFQHAGVMHLLFNSLSFWMFFRALQRRFSRVGIITVSMLAAFLMSFFCYYDKPVVGASGMIYAMTGMYLHLILTHMYKSRFREPMVLYLFVASLIIALGTSFSSPNSAAMLHLLCLIAGFTGAVLLSNR
jgi:membrane associated rhomboid family serine protease